MLLCQGCTLLILNWEQNGISTQQSQSQLAKGVCLLGTFLLCLAAQPSFHLILVIVFGAGQTPMSPALLQGEDLVRALGLEGRKGTLHAKDGVLIDKKDRRKRIQLDKNSFNGCSFSLLINESRLGIDKQE